MTLAFHDSISPGLLAVVAAILSFGSHLAQAQGPDLSHRVLAVNVRDHLNLVIPDYNIYLQTGETFDGRPSMSVYVSPGDWRDFHKNPIVDGDCLIETMYCLQRAKLGETNWMFKLGEFSSTSNLNVTEFTPDSLLEDQALLIEALYSNPSDYFIFRIAAFDLGSYEEDAYMDKYSDFALLRSDQIPYLTLVRKDRMDNKVYFLYFANSGFWILDIDEWFPSSGSADLLLQRREFLDSIENALELIGQ